jgi:hypothetical protein
MSSGNVHRSKVPDRRDSARCRISSFRGVRERNESQQWRLLVAGAWVANYGGLTKTYLVGDWCSGRLFGVAWDDSAKKWQMQEFMQTQPNSLQATSMRTGRC